MRRNVPPRLQYVPGPQGCTGETDEPCEPLLPPSESSATVTVVHLGHRTVHPLRLRRHAMYHELFPLNWTESIVPRHHRTGTVQHPAKP